MGLLNKDDKETNKPVFINHTDVQNENREERKQKNSKLIWFIVLFVLFLLYFGLI